MTNINLEGTYEDYILSKIYDNIPDFSLFSLYLEMNSAKFEDMINTEFTDLNTYENVDYMYSKSTDNLEPYIYKALISKTNDIAITYNISNINEKSTTDKNFDFETDGIWNATNFKFYCSANTIQKVKKLVAELKKYVHTQDIKNRFYTIGADSGGFILNAENTSYVEMDLLLNYGHKFMPVHNEILDALKNQHHGLILLHGDPGTGKCVMGNTTVTLRNKITGEIFETTITDFKNSLTASKSQ